MADEILNMDDYVAYTRDADLPNNIDKNTQVQALLDSANGLIIAYCGLAFGADIKTEPSAVHNKTLFLDTAYVSSVTQIEDLSGNVIPDTDYIINLSAGKVYFNTSAYDGVELTTTYTVEATKHPLLNTLKTAGCMMVDYWLKKEYLPSRTTGDQTSSAPKGIVPPQVQAILDLAVVQVV